MEPHNLASIMVNVYEAVVEPMVPLLFVVLLGFTCARCWRRTFFTPELSSALNRFVSKVTMPFFIFQFAMHADPLRFDYRAIAADVLSKALTAAAVAVWAGFFGSKQQGGDSVGWSITSFALATLTNSLVVGVPVARAMYGDSAQQLVVQLSVLQTTVWLPLQLVVLEIRKATNDDESVLPVTTTDDAAAVVEAQVAATAGSVGAVLKGVTGKLACNSNIQASVIGIAWACIATRLHIKLPSVIEGCVLIMAKPTTAVSMFSMGLFMAQQEKLLGCKLSLAILGLVLKFALGPAAMAIASIAVRLHGDVLRVAIIKAALPQSIASFVFAKEYGLHADVLSTAVILGMLVSLPLLIGFYLVLELIG